MERGSAGVMSIRKPPVPAASRKRSRGDAVDSPDSPDGGVPQTVKKGKAERDACASCGAQEGRAPVKSDVKQAGSGLRPDRQPVMLTAQRKAAIRELLVTHDTFLIDCDGVLWNGSTIRPGAIETVALLRKRGKRVFFITNNSTKSRFAYIEKMTSLGFEGLTPSMMYCSSSLAAMYIAHHHPQIKKVYVVGEKGIEGEMASIGVQPIGGTSAPVPTTYITEDDFAQIELDPEVGAVVCGWDRRFSFLKLSTASLYVHNAHKKPGGCLFIATNRDSADKVTDTRYIPGGGCMVAAIEASSIVPGGLQAICTGKPSTWAVDMLEKKEHIKRASTIMIGDRLDTDILMAQRAGIHSLFVLSGANTADDIWLDANEAVPDFISEDIAILLSALKEAAPATPALYKSAAGEAEPEPEAGTEAEAERSE